jgi:hypothetical protein
MNHIKTLQTKSATAMTALLCDGTALAHPLQSRAAWSDVMLSAPFYATTRNSPERRQR